MTKRIPATMTTEELDYEARYITEIVNFHQDKSIPLPNREAHLDRHAALCAELTNRSFR